MEEKVVILINAPESILSYFINLWKEFKEWLNDSELALEVQNEFQIKCTETDVFNYLDTKWI